MAIKCGNCKGYHDTIVQVRDCNEKQGPTPKQLDFIRSLVAERTDHGITDPDPLFKTLDKQQASKMIEQLLAKPKATMDDFTIPGTVRPDIEGTLPKPGTYTVVIDPLDGDAKIHHRTLRFRKPHPKANFVVVEYLAGPDNHSDFRRFAREAPGGVRLAPRFRQDGRSSMTVSALEALMGADEKKLADMGFQYALTSGNCYRCGRKLTVPASIHRGMGPVCAGKE